MRLSSRFCNAGFRTYLWGADVAVRIDVEHDLQAIAEEQGGFDVGEGAVGYLRLPGLHDIAR